MVQAEASRANSAFARRSRAAQGRGPMKTLFALFALTAFAVAEGIEPIPADKAEMISRALVQALGAPADVPFTSVVDPKKASGIRAGAGGLIFVPETKLTLEAVAAVGKEPLALGQLWMRGASPSVGDAAPAVAKLRTIEMGEGEEKRSAQVYFVSLAKNDAGTLELSFFAKEKEAEILKAAEIKASDIVKSAEATSVQLKVQALKESEAEIAKMAVLAAEKVLLEKAS